MSEASRRAKEEKKALREQNKLNKQVAKDQKKQLKAAKVEYEQQQVLTPEEKKWRKKERRNKKSKVVLLVILAAVIALAVVVNVANPPEDSTQASAQSQTDVQSGEARDFAQNYLNAAFGETLSYSFFNSSHWTALEDDDGCKLFVYKTRVNLDGEDVDITCLTCYTPNTGYELRQIYFEHNGKMLDHWWFKNEYDRMFFGDDSDEYDKYFERAHGSGYESLENQKNEQ